MIDWNELKMTKRRQAAGEEELLKTVAQTTSSHRSTVKNRDHENRRLTCCQRSVSGAGQEIRPDTRPDPCYHQRHQKFGDHRGGEAGGEKL